MQQKISRREKVFKKLPKLFALVLLSGLIQAEEVFSALIPREKPTGRPISRAVERLYDQWNPLEDRNNELYSNFKYTRLKGLELSGEISRRDPTKVIKVDGTYHVWYTGRRTTEVPEGLKKSTDTKPGTDWDLADIWHATSQDGLDLG